MTTISNSTISNSVFKYSVEELTIENAIMDRCTFNGSVDNAKITGSLTKCQFEGLFNGIEVNGPLNDMTIQVDIYPTSAQYVQEYDNPSQLKEIQTLKIDTTTVPRLQEILHKECFINYVKPDNKKTFIVQLSTDDTNPSGTIVMFHPGPIPNDKTLLDMIPKGYAICDGNNGTPDLSGKFIRMVSVDRTNASNPVWEEAGYKPSEDLMMYQEGDTYHANDGRKKYIILQQYHLPIHSHSFNEVTLENTFTANGATDSYTFTYYSNNITWSSTSIYTGGETETSISSPTSSSQQYDVTHQHNITGINVPVRFTFTPMQDQAAEQEYYENRPISVEPEAYALVFIMKL